MSVCIAFNSYSTLLWRFALRCILLCFTASIGQINFINILLLFLTLLLTVLIASLTMLANEFYDWFCDCWL